VKEEDNGSTALLFSSFNSENLCFAKASDSIERKLAIKSYSP